MELLEVLDLMKGPEGSDLHLHLRQPRSLRYVRVCARQSFASVVQLLLCSRVLLPHLSCPSTLLQVESRSNTPFACLFCCSLTQPKKPNATKTNIAGDRRLYGNAETEKCLIRALLVSFLAVMTGPCPRVVLSRWCFVALVDSRGREVQGLLSKFTFDFKEYKVPTGREHLLLVLVL